MRSMNEQEKIEYNKMLKDTSMPLSSHAVLGEVRELKRKLPGWANAESHSVQLDLYYNKAIDDVLKILTKHFA